LTKLQIIISYSTKSKTKTAMFLKLTYPTCTWTNVIS